jgi:hypothetical protein
MSTATITLATPIIKRNRHSVENDIQSALIKRINRLYTKHNCDRKVQVVNGKPTLINTTTGQARPTFFRDLSEYMDEFELFGTEIEAIAFIRGMQAAVALQFYS